MYLFNDIMFCRLVSLTVLQSILRVRFRLGSGLGLGLGPVIVDIREPFRFFEIVSLVSTPAMSEDRGYDDQY